MKAKVGTWIVLVACAALIVGAMAWLTRQVVEAERQRSEADARADLQERIRLSLWRMDSTGAAIVIEENERIDPESLPQPDDNPLVRMRFKSMPDGALVTDRGDENQLAEILDGRIPSPENFAMLCSALAVGSGAWEANNDIVAPEVAQTAQRQDETYQQGYNLKERAMRGGAVTNTMSKLAVSQQQIAQVAPADPPPTVVGVFRASWIGDELFLLRDVRTNDHLRRWIEGVWLDRDEVSRHLLTEAADLLASATLEPIDPRLALEDGMTLASLPLRLVPGETAAVTGPMRGPVITSLVAGWIAVVAGLIAALALVTGVMRLSERRASFVSAVTHELRTPLTTFRLYSDMLESGAVRDEGKQASYFRTMRREADRLSHLVENVLAFSRIERGSERTAVRGQPLRPMLEAMRERFAERLAGAGLELRFGPVEDLQVQGNAAAIEHILFNLIDNAAKYAAAPCEATSVELAARKDARGVAIEVRDHGPGIPSAERGRIFRAFHKSAQAAAESRPGVGLGLALSQRLARQMGGSLDCEAASPGTRFILRLRSAS